MQNRPRYVILLVVVAAAGFSGLIASDPGAAGNPAVILPRESSPWSVSVGATVRSLTADFNLDKPRPLNTSGLFSRRAPRGRGDVGLFKGGAGTIVHDDGQVGPEGILVHAGFNDDGTADSIVNSSSQVSGPTGRLDPTGTPPDIFELSFHSSRETYQYGSGFNGWSASSSDTTVGIGPYLQVSYTLNEGARTPVSLVAGYSWVGTDHGSGERRLAEQWVTETRRLQRFTYVYDHAAGSGISGGPFPFVDTGSWTIFDAAKYNAFYGAGTGAIDPRRRVSQSRSTHVIARFYAVGSADLDVDLHEIPLGIEVGRKLGKLELALVAGATLNLIDYDLSGQLSWYQEGRSAPVASERWRSSASPVKVGLYGGLAARLPLTADGRLYLEAHGTYRWVDPVDAAAGFANVSIDPSSWEGGLGIGFDF